MLRSSILLAAFIATPLLAQQAPVHIEVASIHAHKPNGDDPSNRSAIGGRFVATATTVQTLIRSAFGINPDSILNAPGWTETETFDINAVIADHAEIKTPGQYQQLVLSLLQERFGFRFHREQREGPVYWLVLDKPGSISPALKPTAEGTPINIGMNGDRRIDLRASNITATDLAKSLQKRAGRTIEDRTSLPGHYNVQLHWSTEPTAESDEPDLFTALREQLGLRLQSAKGPIDVVVVDRLNRPDID